MSPREKAKQMNETVNIFFEENTALPILFGDNDCHLQHVEKLMSVALASRGNMLSITGKARDIAATEQVMNKLYAKAVKAGEMTPEMVDAEIRMIPPVPDGKARKKNLVEGVDTDIKIKTFKKAVTPYSHVQANYIRALFEKDLTFALGPAGTGKTYLAVAMAVNLYMTGKVERIILSRPAVEAGEKLGFLPGDIKDKVDPFMRPLYDALFDMMPSEKVEGCIEAGEIELAPLAFMRGRTFSNAAVILDEAQNTTPTQMKMFLTRMGQNSRMLITGDLSQTDLPKDVKSGLRDCLPKLEPIDGVGIIRFSETDVVRHPLAARIVKAYDDWDAKKQARIEAARKVEDDMEHGAEG